MEFDRLTDLHAHLGGSTDLKTLYDIAVHRGMRLPAKSFNEFKKMYSSKNPIENDVYHNIYQITQEIQSDRESIYRSVYDTFTRYAVDKNVDYLELRFNPMLRNNGGKYDMDNIILSALEGMHKATQNYSIDGGLIIETDRSFTAKKHRIIAEKAEKYMHDGIVGFDVSGRGMIDLDEVISSYQMLHNNGMKLTMHAGETDGQYHELVDLMNSDLYNKLDRIGHGIQLWKNREDESAVYVAEWISECGIILELCPTSNIMLGIIKGGWDEYVDMIKWFDERGIKWCINTDGSELFGGIGASYEYNMLVNHGLGFNDAQDNIYITNEFYTFRSRN